MSEVQQQLALKQCRDSLNLRITQAQSFFNTALECQIHQAKAWYEDACALQAQYESNNQAIFKFNSELTDDTLKIATEADSKKFFENVVVVKSGYYSLKAKVDAAAISKQTPPTPQSTGKIKPANKLPPIKIEPFGGDISQWPTFIGLYNSLLHTSTDYTDIEKFRYLQSLLRDEALACISQYTLDASNYADAYQALVDRYENKRRLANYHVSQLLNFKNVYNKPTFQTYLQTHENAINALRNLKLNDLTDFILFQLAYNNLDSRTQKDFDMSPKCQSIPDVKSLFQFIETLARTEELKLDSSSKNKEGHNLNNSNGSKSKGPGVFVARQQSNYSNNYQKPSCDFCKGEHRLISCKKFLDLDVEGKRDKVKQMQLCFNCLRSNHMINQCKSESKCKKCGSKHNTFLHRDNPNSDSKQSDVSNNSSNVNNTVKQDGATSSDKLTTLHISAESNSILLGTVFLYIQDSYGQLHPAKAVLDNCSQTCLITVECAKRIGLKAYSSSSSISGVQNVQNKSLGKVDCQIISRFKTGSPLAITAEILPTITGQLPSSYISTDVYKKFAHLPLADTQFYKPTEIDLLLDTNVYTTILSDDSPNVIKGFPTAIKTSFGWVLKGSISSDATLSNPISMLCKFTPSLEETMNKFWDSEEVKSESQAHPEDIHCEIYFTSTVQRSNDDGKYIVKLPFKDDKQRDSLVNNQERVLRDYKILEARLNKNPEQKSAYHKFMQEYLQLGHMQVAKTKSDYLIPHHVIHKVSSTTKTRVVFNGSAKDATGKSLNDLLCKGPKLQKDISHILNSFRLHEVALTADMKMMFRQILIHDDDRKFQHILYRPHENSEIKEFELNTLTYGFTSSPYLAIRCVQQLVKDEGTEFPLASHVLMNDTYVDDVVTGADTSAEALALQSQLNELLSKCGFSLRKWASNDPKLLQHLSDDLLEVPLAFQDHLAAIKVLGIGWDSKTDQLRYTAQEFKGIPTKRNILSFIARIYDPIGLVGPIVFWLKYLMQKLWILKLDWDDVVPIDIQTEFEQFFSTFLQVSNIQINRKIPYLNCSLNLIGFCDASERGYASVIYIQSEFNGQFNSFLLGSKSRVAPLKKQTIPKLELAAMVLLTKHVHHVLQFRVSEVVQKTFLFSDSVIALNWIKTPPYQLEKAEKMVANQVSNIQEDTKHFQWLYVPSKLNAADIASRGADASILVNNETWWSGPEFLKQHPDEWNQTVPLLTDLQLPPSTSKVKKQTLLVVDKEPDVLYNMILHCSSFTKLLRQFAWIIKFCKWKLKLPIKDKVLNVDDLTIAQNTIVKIVQKQHFAEDIKLIQDGKPATRKLMPLAPFLDEQAILRVGGRINKADISYGAKHPFILPNDHFSQILCRHYHYNNFHAGFRTTNALITQIFWILSGKTVLKSAIYKCIICTKYRKPRAPFMADLPKSRFDTTRAFNQTGTDFAGPFYVTDNSLRKSRVMKSYLCVFICMSTKAVHLEITTELTTEAFLAAFHRFVSRRGLPHSIYSDNGSNYQGASNQIKEIETFLADNSDQILSALAMRQVKWVFNPPEAPNFGGLWEAAVKSVKTLLYKHVGQTTYSFEQLNTLACRVEAILNSRPLTFDVDDPKERDYLSPGSFLIGAPLLSLPELPIPENKTFKGRFVKMNQISQAIWRRFHTEYLSTLQNRYKWSKPGDDIKLNQLVYITEINSAPLSWPLGRVIQLYPGSDGIIRVVKVKTSSGEYMRPVNKLILVHD